MIYVTKLQNSPDVAVLRPCIRCGSSSCPPPSAPPSQTASSTPPPTPPSSSQQTKSFCPPRRPTSTPPSPHSADSTRLPRSRGRSLRWQQCAISALQRRTREAKAEGSLVVSSQARIGGPATLQTPLPAVVTPIIVTVIKVGIVFHPSRVHGRTSARHALQNKTKIIANEKPTSPANKMTTMTSSLTRCIIIIHTKHIKYTLKPLI